MFSPWGMIPVCRLYFAGCQSTYLSFGPSLDLTIDLSFAPSFDLSIDLSFCPSFDLSICLRKRVKTKTRSWRYLT